MSVVVEKTYSLAFLTLFECWKIYPAAPTDTASPFQLHMQYKISNKPLLSKEHFACTLFSFFFVSY